MKKTKKGKVTKACREEEEFGKFGTWGFTYPQGDDPEEYVPREYALGPLAPDYWHELPKLITPAQWEQAEVNRLNALGRLYENGHITWTEKEFRAKKRQAL